MPDSFGHFVTYKLIMYIVFFYRYIFRELDYQSPSVRAKLTEWKKIHNRALASVHSVCATVMDVLSNPSPEGNVPSSFREMEEAIDDLIDECGDEGEDNSSGPKHQVILSCCWRAVKEARYFFFLNKGISMDRNGLFTLRRFLSLIVHC